MQRALLLSFALIIPACGGGGAQSTPPPIEEPPDPGPDYCIDIELNARGGFDDIIQRWVGQDDALARRQGSVVFVGSSSIRYWESLYQNFSSMDPIQRGFGGSRIWDVAQNADALIARHSPSAVVVFASNSIPQGLTAEQTVEGFQCLVQRLESSLGEVPVVYIGMTPVPARWDIWPEFNEANLAIQAFTNEKGNLFYLDAPTEFLLTGSPPSTDLFQNDQIHLTEEGYQIWLDLLTPLLQSILPLPPSPPISTLDSTERILIDLSSGNPEEGTPTASPDEFGQVWNNWVTAENGNPIYAGESLGGLVDTNGTPTNVRLLFTGGMEAGGILSGGLRNPDSALLDHFAIDTATQDYIYATANSLGAGSFSFIGLDTQASYTLRLFGSRDASDSSITRYSASGSSDLQQIDLQISGSGIGENGDGNDSDVAVFTGVQPDAAGAIYIDFSAETGNTAYLNVVELIAE